MNDDPFNLKKAMMHSADDQLIEEMMDLERFLMEFLHKAKTDDIDKEKAAEDMILFAMANVAVAILQRRMLARR
jgi:hypothetical protein